MSHDRPWEDVDSSGIEFGEVMKLPMVDMGSPWDGSYGTITPLHLSIGGDKDLSQRTRDIVVDDPVWQKMLLHAMATPQVEVGGFLLGSSWREVGLGSEKDADDGLLDSVWVQGIVPAEYQESQAASLRITHESWHALTKKHHESGSPLAIVGWYHSHPNWGVFLSDMDQFICKGFFSAPASLALVIDPLQKLAGCFEWDAQCQRMLRRSAIHLRVSKEQEELRREGQTVQNERLQDPRLHSISDPSFRP